MESAVLALILGGSAGALARVLAFSTAGAYTLLVVGTVASAAVGSANAASEVSLTAMLKIWLRRTVAAIVIVVVIVLAAFVLIKLVAKILF